MPAVASAAGFSNANRSPGWQSSTSQSFSSVPNRMAFALPVFNTERFCAVMPTSSASSFRRILRRASITSRFTTIGMWMLRSDHEFGVALQRVRVILLVKADVHDPRDEQDEPGLTKELNNPDIDGNTRSRSIETDA